MKKLVLVLAVLLISLPALASNVAVTATYQCDGTYAVTYTTDGNLPRAFALDITVSTGTITAVGDLSAVYDIYPGSIVIVDGAVSDAGSAVCDASYPDTLGGLGTAGITVEMGSLYAAGDTASTPTENGTLFTFTVSDEAAVVTVALNGIRGGVVMEDVAEEAAVAFTIDPGQCGPPPCPKDLDGDGWITPDDLNTILIFLIPYEADGYMVEATPATAYMDLDGDGWITPDDLNTILIYLIPYVADGYMVECPQQ